MPDKSSAARERVGTTHANILRIVRSCSRFLLFPVMKAMQDVQRTGGWRWRWLCLRRQGHQRRHGRPTAQQLKQLRWQWQWQWRNRRHGCAVLSW